MMKWWVGWGGHLISQVLEGWSQCDTFYESLTRICWAWFLEGMGRQTVGTEQKGERKSKNWGWWLSSGVCLWWERKRRTWLEGKLGFCVSFVCLRGQACEHLYRGKRIIRKAVLKGPQSCLISHRSCSNISTLTLPHNLSSSYLTVSGLPMPMLVFPSFISVHWRASTFVKSHHSFPPSSNPSLSASCHLNPGDKLTEELFWNSTGCPVHKTQISKLQI